MNGLLAILGAAIFFGGFAGALRIASQKNRSWGEVFFYFPIASGLLLIVLILLTLFIAHLKPGVSGKFIWLSSYLGASILGLLLLHQWLPEAKHKTSITFSVRNRRKSKRGRTNPKKIGK